MSMVVLSNIQLDLSNLMIVDKLIYKLLEYLVKMRKLIRLALNLEKNNISNKCVITFI